MSGFKGRFTSIKDISDRRRLPRMGKIRLGIKKISKTSGKEFPSETDYFVCPEEVQKKFGEKPKELPIMFPIEDRETVFPQSYKFYGQSRGLKCIGNGETAIEFGEDGGVERECPCEKLDGDCQRRAHLMVLIPKVSLAGVYQIDLGSYHSIVDINSGIDYIRAMVGRFSWVPLVLSREPRETHGSGKKTIHYTLSIKPAPEIDNISTINALREDTKKIIEGPRYAIPAPEDINPKMDEGATVEYTDEEDEDRQEPSEEKPSEKQPEVYKDLLNQIRNKVIDTKNLGQAEMLVPKNLTKIEIVKLVNFLVTAKEMEVDEWHRERDKILAK